MLLKTEEEGGGEATGNKQANGKGEARGVVLSMLILLLSIPALIGA